MIRREHMLAPLIGAAGLWDGALPEGEDALLLAPLPSAATQSDCTLAVPRPLRD